MCIYILCKYIYTYTSIGTIGLDPIETYFVLSTPLKNQRKINWDRHPSSESCDCFLNMSETHTPDSLVDIHRLYIDIPCVSLKMRCSIPVMFIHVPHV